MSRLTVRLPNALHQQLEALAREEGVSLNHYIVYALTRQATMAEHSPSGKSSRRPKTGAASFNKAEPELDDFEPEDPSGTFDAESEARLRRRPDDFPPPENK